MITSPNPILMDYVPLTCKQKLNNHVHRLPNQIQTYILSLFPIIQWIHRYNLSWLFQDMIAGITVGMLIVPQGIAYAKVAGLDPQYGLYTSFVGMTLYCFFGTSKDISIGPITVVSLLTGEAIARVKETHPEITGPEVAVCLSLFTGLVCVLIGLVRLGILVDFISEPAIAGYMTGSAITISMGQWPKVFGLKHVNTHDAPYAIVISFFQHLPETQLDAAFGLTALFALYAIKIGGARLATRVPSLKKPLFFLGIMRSGLIVMLGTAISYIINLDHRAEPLIDIIQDVPAGFDAMAVPSINMTILKEASGVLPSIIIIMILEHVSVAKSFGRVSNYTINPNQEILAIGMSNAIGAFLGKQNTAALSFSVFIRLYCSAYPATGAFSRTAVMSRSGAKTPMAGVFSGAVVVLALYALTPAFYYIPESVLGAVVIHAVIDLISGPAFLKELWGYSVLEFIIFVAAVIITCFLDVETAIYISIATSLFFMLLRLARPKVISVGRVKLSHASNNVISSSSTSTSSTAYNKSVIEDVYAIDTSSRYIYVDENDVNFKHLLNPLPPGVVVIQLSQSILYPNANHVTERISDIVKSRTRSGRPDQDYGLQEPEQAWNQPTLKEDALHVKPYLQCIVLDFSSVATLDATALHTLNSLKKTFIMYTRGREVEWHFCHAQPHVRQLLINAGFGTLPSNDDDTLRPPMYRLEQFDESTANSLCDPMGFMTIDPYFPSVHDKQPVIEMCPTDKYPGFHWDLESAIYSICIRRKQKANDHSLVHVTVY